MKNAKQVRENIGFVQQETTVDEYLTGRENLLLQAKLNHIPKNEINQRIDEVLELIELSDKQTSSCCHLFWGNEKEIRYCWRPFTSSKSFYSLMNPLLD